MERLMKRLAGGAVLAAVLFAALYGATAASICFSLFVTGATAAYHLLMRLTVGAVLDRLPQNLYPAPWFRTARWEPALYRRLRVKAWKNKLPTYHPAY